MTSTQDGGYLVPPGSLDFVDLPASKQRQVTFNNGSELDAWADLPGGASVLIPAGHSVTVELSEEHRVIGGLRYVADAKTAGEVLGHYGLDWLTGPKG
jgi:hypothetical protein